MRSFWMFKDHSMGRGRNSAHTHTHTLRRTLQYFSIRSALFYQVNFWVRSPDSVIFHKLNLLTGKLSPLPHPSISTARATAEGEAKGQADITYIIIDTKCCFTALPVNQQLLSFLTEIGSSEVSFYLREQRHIVKKHFIITESKNCVA